jgi:hypothetical protein
MYFFTNTVKEEPSDGEVLRYYKTTVSKAFMFEGLNFALFSVAHWIFAILIWFTAEKLT